MSTAGTKRRQRGEETLTRVATLDRRSLSSEARSVEVSFSSETDEVTFYGTPEVLLHVKGALDLRKLRSVGSVLFNHNPDQIVGRPEDIRLDEAERKGRARIVFDSDPESERIFQKVQNGSLRGVSVGFRVQRWQVLNDGEDWTSPEGRPFRGPVDIATKWRPVEFSLTPVPADGAVGVNRARKDYPMPRKHPTETLSPIRDQLDAGDDLDRDDDEAEFVRAAERERVREIRNLCSIHDCLRGLEPDLVDGGVDIGTARKRALAVLQEHNSTVPTQRRIEVDSNSKDRWARCVEDKLNLRVGNITEKSDPQAYGRACEVRENSLADLARACLERAGVRPPPRADEIIKRAISHTSSDYSGILENVASKSLLRGWSEAPAAWPRIAAIGNVRDFKPTSRPKLGDAGDLVLTPDTAPLAEGSVPDATLNYKLSTYTKAIGLGRQLIISDDLDALGNIPRLHGAAARRLPDKLLFTLLLSGTSANGPLVPEGGGSLQFFSDSHASGDNRLAGALDDAGLAAAFLAMRKTKGFAASGEVAPILNLSPAILLTPAGLEHAARKLLTAISATKTTDVNPFGAAGLELVVSPLLDATSATIWYLGTGPSVFPGIEVGFLDGRTEPASFPRGIDEPARR